MVSKQRLKRLTNDRDHLIRELEGNNFVSVVESKGNPPNRYIIAYDIKGVAYDASTGQTSYITHHEVEITLFTEYPTSPPYCKMKTAIFHPNMSTSEIWIADEGSWSASKSLLDIVKQIGCMISYQDYNVDFPLNEEAARWAKNNEKALPLDSTDFFARDTSKAKEHAQLEHEAHAKTYCTYCLCPDPSKRCNNGHPACDDCLATCKYCSNITCLACADNTCGECKEKIEAHYSEIASAVKQGNMTQAASVAKNALERFNDVPELTECLDKVERINKTIAYIESCRQSRCYHGMARACQELRSLELESDALAKLETVASDKFKAADASVAEGKKELQVNRNPQRACQHFSHALQLVSDHPSAYKQIEKAKARIVEAKKHVESAQEQLATGQYDLAIEDANKALSLDSAVGSKAQEVINTASHLQSLERRKNKRRLMLVSAALLTVLVTLFVCLFVWQDRRHKAEYHLFLAELENEPTPEAKVEALSVYIISHRRNRFTRDAERHLSHLNAVIEEREFQIAKRNASIMLKNKDYEKAETAYKQYLSQNPSTLYATELNRSISEVHSMLDDRDYETLQWLSRCNPKTKVGAYNAYIAKHPEGKHREEVKALILNTTEAYYKYFKEEIERIKNDHKWDECVDLCNQFDKNLGESMWMEEVAALRGECGKRRDDAKALAALIAEADAKGGDYEAAKQVYLQYLKDHSDSSVKMNITNRINMLDEKIRSERTWEKIQAQITSGENDLDEKIGMLRKYMAQNPAGQHVEEATQELKGLEERRDRISWKKIMGSCGDSETSIQGKISLVESFIQRNVSGEYLGDAKTKLSDLKKEQAWRSWKDVERFCNDQRIGMSDRINKLMLFTDQNPSGEFVQSAQLMLHKLRRFHREEEIIRHRIAETGNMFVYNNGTITDVRTGLMWCAFDSYLDLQTCLKYEAAQTYVKRIRYGGYTDWRLPSEVDLRYTYKSKPFFPTVNEGQWYWTSNEGGGNMVPVVTTQRETEWQMAKIESYMGCGSVRAVRGP